jgi:site-specific recombinase XerD
MKDIPYLQKENLQKLINKVQWDTLIQLFGGSIKEYNQNPHKGERFFLMSPDFMDSSLQNVSPRILIPDQIVGPNDQSTEAKEIASYQGLVINKYAGNWFNFFLDWREEQNIKFEQILQLNKKLTEQHQELKDQIAHLTEINQRIEAIEMKRQQEEEERKQRILRKKNRKQKEPRAYVSYSEFRQILDCAKTASKFELVTARIVVCIALLYLTGLRVSNLLLLSRQQVYDLLHTGEIDLRIIKGGKDQQLICIGASGRNILKELTLYIDIIGQAQPDNARPFFFALSDPTIPINRLNFDKQCNKVLTKMGLRFCKSIKTHSFRATFITDLLQSGVTIQKVRDIIGHKSIMTTDRYRRTELGLKEHRRTLASFQRARIDSAYKPIVQIPDELLEELDNEDITK